MIFHEIYFTMEERGENNGTNEIRGNICDIGHEIREKIIRYPNGEEEIIIFANKINDGKVKEEIVKYLQYLMDKYHVSIDFLYLGTDF